MRPDEVFRVGPVDDEDGSLYVPVSRERPMEMTDASSDVDGIRQIIAQWPEATYVCSPDLAEAASQLGLASGEMEPDTEGTRISIALSVAQDPDFDDIGDPWAVLRLMSGAQDVLHLAGAERWPPRLSMEIELRGDRQAKWYGAKTSVPYPGIVLFREAQEAKACSLLAAEAQPAFWAERPHLRVQLEPGPEFAMKWIRDFYRIERMPSPDQAHAGADARRQRGRASDGRRALGAGQGREREHDQLRGHEVPRPRGPTFIDAGSPWPFVDV